MKHSPGKKPMVNEKFIPDPPIKKVQSLPVKETEQTKETEHADEKPGDASGLEDGMRLFRLKRWEDSLQTLLQVDKDGFSSDQRVELAYYLGLCYAKLGLFDEALLYLEQVVIAGGDLLRVYQCRLAIAYVYIKTGRARMAEFELKRLRSSGFESAQMYNTLAYAAYAQKRYRNAVELYEKALDLDNENATALNGMGYILADTGMDKMRGLRLCRKAMEQKPQNPAYLDSLGWAYYRCGELPEARSFLRRALELAPEEKEIKDHFRIANGEAV